jgi:hypothetical protein
MNWLIAVGLGACGGAIVEGISAWGNVIAWQKARHQALASARPKLPSLTRYIDPVADGLVALTRLILGALAALLFHAQVTGSVAIIAVGASAPALLRQLGTARSIAALSSSQGSETAQSAASLFPGAPVPTSEEGAG